MPGKLRRRRLLALCGAAVATGTAGCLGDDDEDGDDGERAVWGSTPGYASWVGAAEVEEARDEADDFVLAYLDVARLDEFEDGQAVETITDGDPEETEEDAQVVDPMLAMPATGALAFLLGVGFGTFGYPFMADVRLTTVGSGSDDGSEPAADVEEGLLVGDAAVLWGDVDAEAIVDAAEGFERAESRGRFDLYEQVEEGAFGGPLAFGVADDALVLAIVETGEDGPDALEALRERVDVGIGEAPRAVDEDDGFERLARATDPGTMLLGVFGDDVMTEATNEDDSEEGDEFEEDEFGGFDEYEQGFQDLADLGGPEVGVFSSMDLGDDGDHAAEITVGYEDADARPSRDAVEDVLGVAADDRTVTIEDAFVHVSGEGFADQPL